MSEMDAPDNRIDVSDHKLIGNDKESHVDLNDIERNGYGNDEVEIIVCSVTSETDTASVGESWASDTALNSYTFDIDGTVCTCIVNLEASLQRDDNNKERHQEEEFLLTKDNSLPTDYEQYCSLLSVKDPQRRYMVAKDIPTVDSHAEESLHFNGDSSCFSENEGENNVNDSVAHVNEQEEEVMSLQDNLNDVNENSVTIENEQHVEVLNVTYNLLRREKDKKGDDLHMNDDSVGIENEPENTVLFAQENSVLSLTDKEEKDILLRETFSFYDDKENVSHVAKPEDETLVHLLSCIKKEEHDSNSNIQNKSNIYNRKKTKMHTCKTCNKHFARFDNLKRHSYLHESDHLPLACNICSRTFVWKRNLARHMKFCAGNGQYKSNRPSFSCKFCSRTFPWKRNLARHVEICKGNGQYASDRPSFTCKVCSGKFFWKQNLARHLKLHEENSTFSCEICSKNLSGKYELERHMLIHLKSEQLVCDICMRTFRRKDSLTKHIKDHFRFHNFDCKICLVQFSNESSLIRHMNGHPDQKHTYLYAVEKFEKQQQQNKNDLYSCDFCLQSFNMKGSHVKHMELHCRLDNHSCDICFEECSDQSTLNRHMAIHLLAKDDLIPCVYEQDNSASSGAKHDSIPNVYEYEENHLLSSVEETERKNMGINNKSALSAISQKEKLSLVKEIVNELKGKSVHVKYRLMSSKNEEAANVGNSITSTKHEKLKNVKTKDDSLTSVNHPIGEVCQLEENTILSLYERKENTNHLLTTVKEQHIETFNAMDNSVSSLDKEEGKYLILEKELSVKDENEQDSYETAQNFEFPIHNFPSVIKKRNDSVSNIHAQIKLKGHKRESFESYTCGKCNKRFSSSLCLKRHSVLYKHDLPSFTCKVCSHKTAKKGNLIRHMKVHGVCGVCLKKFSRRKDLDLHMATVHSTKHELYFCDLCSQTFVSKFYLVRHIEDHFRVEQVVCKICSIQFSNRNSLSHHMHVHLDGKHLESDTDVTLKRQKHKHSCSVCQKLFLNDDDLNRHITVHSNRYLCDLCHKGFSSQRHLTRHIKTHLRLGFIPCKICSKTFRDTTSLNRHMKMHPSSDQSKLYCNQCNQHFDTISDFNLHRLQHEGSHKCNICPRVFSLKSNLKRHVMQYHFKIGLLCCKICGKESQNKTLLSRHMIAKHSYTSHI